MRNNEDGAGGAVSRGSGGHEPAQRQAQRPAAAPALADLLRAARFELLPTSGTEEEVLAHLPTDRMLTVTASPGKGLDATLDLAVALAGHGYAVVPHLAARMVVDRSHLAELSGRLSAAGVERVFVPGGDADPVGQYADSTSLLADLAALGSPFAHVGIAAYPESHPSIPDDLTIQAMWDKRHHATEMVSNITFDPAVVGDWLSRVRRRGIALPLWLGVPGPTDPARLLTIATRIGVGDSTRFLLKHRRTVARLLAPGGFRSEDFLRRAAPALTRPDAGVAGLHVFTFNQVAETEAWRTRLLDDLEHPRRHRRHRSTPLHHAPRRHP